MFFPFALFCEKFYGFCQPEIHSSCSYLKHVALLTCWEVSQSSIIFGLQIFILQQEDQQSRSAKATLAIRVRTWTWLASAGEIQEPSFMLLMRSLIMSAAQTIHPQTLYITLQMCSHIEILDKIFLNSKFINSNLNWISGCKDLYSYIVSFSYSAILWLKILLLLVEKKGNEQYMCMLLPCCNLNELPETENLPCFWLARNHLNRLLYF